MNIATEHERDLTETIAAIATPPGRGGVGIVRISGPQTKSIATSILGSLPKARHATYTAFQNNKNETIDVGIALYFESPNSFTGEDVLELQAHGGPFVLDKLIQTVLSLGARIARPGEFSERAFLNGKMDLTQAEAIADLINASTEQASQSAMRSMQGEFSKKIQILRQELIALRTHVEAAIDFPDEEIDFLSDGVILDRLITIKDNLNLILTTASQGVILQEGISMVICGKPNSGKSTLLNTLSGYERAIVTDIAGTTRDVMRETINIDGLPVHIIDTAGLRETIDIVEHEGIKRAWQEVAKADLILLVIDEQDHASDEIEDSLKAQVNPNRIIKIINKIDLKRLSPKTDDNTIFLSAKEKSGIDLLKEKIKSFAGFHEHIEGNFIARRRHLTALQKAEEALKQAHVELIENQAGELVAEECRIALEALSTITGEFSTEDLLGEIFSSFCIGK